MHTCMHYIYYTDIYYTYILYRCYTDICYADCERYILYRLYCVVQTDIHKTEYIIQIMIYIYIYMYIYMYILCRLRQETWCIQSTH